PFQINQTIFPQENRSITDIQEEKPQANETNATTENQFITDVQVDGLQNKTTAHKENQSITDVQEDKPLYLEVGQKHVPSAAIEIFERYDVSMEMKQEEKDQITPLENFFIMGSNIPKEMDELAEDPNIYRLEIVGEVENPVNLTYEDLITQFKFKHMITEMYCTPSLNGIGKFSGPSLYEVIQYAKPLNGNMKVVFNAADGYEKGWYKEYPLDEIKAHSENYLIAVTMNGYPLAIEHGYPARLALDSRQGSQWVKWLIKITIVSEDRARYVS
ncbi:MAG: molybdopterin-dependent oxidoreductase, partial [Candidatus Bathyarchaeota archaeon]|nr:molybdopterin-dependent oxidoreductase [Candidatus Bathyarchaeota archaeon]